MKQNHLSSAVAAIMAVSMLLATAPPSQAQGLLGALFGLFGDGPGRHRPLPPGPDIPPDQAPDPAPGRETAPVRPGQGLAYCVRSCDGRYFPVVTGGQKQPAALCHALCPAAETRVYWGRSPDKGPQIGADGSPYEDLPAAFSYRQRLTANCTCNGRDALGLAQLAAQDDPTLQRGDIVVRKEGMTVFDGATTASGQIGGFTPLAQAQGLSPDMRRELARMAH